MLEEEQLAALARIEAQLKTLTSGGHDAAPLDQTYYVSNTQGFFLDYKGRKKLYLFATAAMTLSLADIGTLAVSANTWTDISFRQGLQLFTTNLANPTAVLVRATNEIIEGASTGNIPTVNQGTSPWVVSVSNANANGQATMANSSPVVIASNQSAVASNLSQVNGAALSTSNPVLTEDQIRALIVAGQGFVATSGVLATATNANVYIAMGLLASNIAKNVFIYRILAGPQNTSGDYHLATMTAFDANVATAVTPANLSLGSATTPLATVKSTANGNTAPTSSTGTNIIQYGSAANLGAMEFLQNGAGIFIPAGQTQGVTAWIKIPTAANSGQITMFWVEF